MVPNVNFLQKVCCGFVAAVCDLHRCFVETGLVEGLSSHPESSCLGLSKLQAPRGPKP